MDSTTPPPPDTDDAIARVFRDFVGGAVPRAAAGPRRLGAFELGEVLGEGGFGIVYRAHQTGQLDRDVAVKLLRSPLIGHEANQRFEFERRVLARLSHPGIASIFEAGVSDTGQPYFAMELVDGAPITTYCERLGLPLAARLRIFVEVCRAVHYAHEQGVVHRDLKPANVLVATRAGVPAPKVIDFGIAKAGLDDLGVSALRTRTGQIIGTPEYMSPEQADGTLGGVDARCDVYSLGVLVYELVTGTLPLFEQGTTHLSLHELISTLRDVDPERPSRRLERKGEAARRAVRGRGRRSNSSAFSRDLDWIALRALEKAPERRYPSAAALADDIEAFLDGRPVRARPPSRLYAAQRFVGRHRGLVAANLLVIASLAVGAAVSWSMWQEAVASGDEARLDRTRREGLRLAAEARLISSARPTLSLLLALEAARHVVEAPVRTALYEGLARLTEEAVCLGHQRHQRDTPWRVALALGGAVLVSGCADPFLLLWDADDGAPLGRLTGEGAPLTSFTMDRAGAKVAATAVDGTLTVWELATRRRTLTWRAGAGPLNRAAFDAAGERVAVVAASGAIHVLEVASGRVLRRIDAAPGGWTALAFLPSDDHLAATTPERFQVWSLSDGALTADVAGDDDTYLYTYFELVVHPTEDLVALPAHSKVEQTFVARVVDRNGAVQHKAHGLDPKCFSSDGRWLCGETSFSGSPASWARFELATGAKDDLGLLGHGARLPDGTTYNGGIYAPDGSQLSPPGAGHRYDPRFVLADEARGRFITISEDRSIRFWNTRLATAPRRLPTGGDPAHVLGSLGILDDRVLARSAGGLLVLRPLPGDPGSCEVFDVERSETLLTLRGVDPGSARFSDDGTRVVAMRPFKGEALDASTAPQIHVVEVPSGATSTWVLSEPFHDFAVRPDGRECLVMRSTPEETGDLFRLDLTTGRETAAGPWVRYNVSVFAAWTPDFAQVVVREDAERSTLRNLQDGRAVRSFRGHGGDHLSYTISPNGRQLLSTAVDRSVALHDLATGELLWSWGGLDELCYRCGFAQDGALAWTLNLGALRLFDVATGALWAELRPPRGEFVDAIEDVGGEWLVTLTKDGWLQRWPFDPVGYAQRVVPRSLEPEEYETYGIGDPAERRARLIAHAREVGTGTRYARVARALQRAGDAATALELLEEGVATGTHETGVWNDLYEALCDAAGSTTDAAERARLVDRAVEVLQRSAELGADPRVMAANGAPELFAGHAGFEALVGGAEAVGGG